MRANGARAGGDSGDSIALRVANHAPEVLHDCAWLTGTVALSRISEWLIRRRETDVPRDRSPHLRDSDDSALREHTSHAFRLFPGTEQHGAPDPLRIRRRRIMVDHPLPGIQPVCLPIQLPQELADGAIFIRVV